MYYQPPSSICFFMLATDPQLLRFVSEAYDQVTGTQTRNRYDMCALTFCLAAKVYWVSTDMNLRKVFSEK